MERLKVLSSNKLSVLLLDIVPLPSILLKKYNYKWVLTQDIIAKSERGLTAGK